MSIPAPLFAIGDAVFFASTKSGADNVQCPDCLGEKEWSVRSPSGYEAKTKCPRCNGSGLIRKQFQYEPTTRQLTVGSVRMDTNDKDDVFTYMCNETGVGSGSVYRESKLFPTDGEAMDAAQIIATEQTRSMHQNRPDLNRDLNLYDLPYKDAEIAEHRKKEMDAIHAYMRLIERICELDEFPVAGGEFSDEATASISVEQVRGVQNSLVWLDRKATDELIAYREESH